MKYNYGQLLLKLKEYLLKNDERFKLEEMEKVVYDFDAYYRENQGSGVISDELYDFFASLSDDIPARHIKFGEQIVQKYPAQEFTNLLDVGAGRVCKLSQYLLERGYSVTAMDPNIRLRIGEIRGLKALKKEFSCDEYSNDHHGTDISEFDLVIGLEPCEATEHIIRQCLKHNKPFAVDLCMSPHESLDGQQFETYDDWHNYLGSISQDVTIERYPNGQVIASGGRKKEIDFDER